MHSKANFIIVGVAAVAAILFVAHLATTPKQASPNTSASASVPSAIAPASVISVGGYAIGPASAIRALGAEGDRGVPNGCETPPPTADERASWKPTPSPRAKDRLADLAGGKDEVFSGEVTERLLDKIYGAGYAAMSEPEKNAYLITVLEAEVSMSGIDDYLAGRSGNCAMQTLAALRAVGYVDEATAFGRILAAFPGARPAEDRAARFDQMKAMVMRPTEWKKSETFETLTSSPLFTGYVRKHLASFDLPPN